MSVDFDTLVADLRAERKFIDDLTPQEKKCLEDNTMISLSNIKAAFEHLYLSDTLAQKELQIFLSALRAVEREGDS
jgi:capsule polysaccharide export protein KpsE/RkpR